MTLTFGPLLEDRENTALEHESLVHVRASLYLKLEVKIIYVTSSIAGSSGVSCKVTAAVVN